MLITMEHRKQQTPGAAREAKRREGIRHDLRAIMAEIAELRRELGDRIFLAVERHPEPQQNPRHGR
jgi:hypothetical protein